MNNKTFCIVIPIYKNTPDIIETISLQRLNKIIGNKNYDVYFITYDGLDIHKYIDLYPNAKITLFDKYFFNSTKTYSELCLNYDFYNRYSDYKYMYIYQTDCYIYTDVLEDFCNLNYDYIGSPIFSTDCGWPTITEVNGEQHYKPVIGNGGFSLRKINTFKNILDPNGEFRQYVKLTDDILKQVVWEDLFICVTIAKYYDLHIAPLEIGELFSWDMSVDVMYNLWGNHNFPMCIHAWDKNIRFWQLYLEELKNNQEVIDFCEEKHKEFFKLYYNERNETFR